MYGTDRSAPRFIFGSACLVAVIATALNAEPEYPADRWKKAPPDAEKIDVGVIESEDFFLVFPEGAAGCFDRGDDLFVFLGP